MAERTQINMYYPPEWTPEKGSLDKFHGHHPLGYRARKISKGILIVRFEMPFNVWCLGCHRHIGMGVRFNAEKKAVGHYFSTKIYSFRMCCPSCSQTIEIRTDPEHRDYAVTAGARRKNETWETGPEINGAVKVLLDEREKVAAKSDILLNLERKEDDRQRGLADKKALCAIMEREAGREDAFLLNRMARDRNREARHEQAALKSRGKEMGLGIPLLPEGGAAEKAEDDREVEGLHRERERASLKRSAVVLNSDGTEERVTPDEALKRRRLEIKSSSIFGKAGTTTHESLMRDKAVAKIAVARHNSTKGAPKGTVNGDGKDKVKFSFF